MHMCSSQEYIVLLHIRDRSDQGQVLAAEPSTSTLNERTRHEALSIPKRHHYIRNLNFRKRLGTVKKHA